MSPRLRDASVVVGRAYGGGGENPAIRANTSVWTGSRCAFTAGHASAREFTSQSASVPSSPPDASREPSGLNARAIGPWSSDASPIGQCTFRLERWRDAVRLHSFQKRPVEFDSGITERLRGELP